MSSNSSSDQVRTLQGAAQQARSQSAPPAAPPAHPLINFLGTPSEVCRHIGEILGNPELQALAPSLRGDYDIELRGETPRQALERLATWPATADAAHRALAALNADSSTDSTDNSASGTTPDPRYARARDSLIAFAQLMFGKRFRVRPVARLLAGKLEEATRTTEAGGRARKIVNVPPQVGKTRLVSRLFVAWFMGRNPYLNVILACHNAKLAASIGDDVLSYMKSADYRKIFPDVRVSDSSSSKTEFKLIVTDTDGDHVGGEFGAYGRGGGYTGHGAHLLVLDDILKETEADSAAALEDVQKSIQALTSRLDPEGVSCVIVPNTRYRQNDGCGFLLDEYASEGPWDVVVAPLYAESERFMAVGKTKGEDGQFTDVMAQVADHVLPPCMLLDGTELPQEVWLRPEGDVLAPYGVERAERLRAKLLRTAPNEFWGQYQQRPVAATGNMIDPSCLRPYTVTPLTLDRRSYARVVISGDTGEGKNTVTGARSAFGVHGEPFDSRNSCEACQNAPQLRGGCTACRGSGLGPASRLLELAAYPWQQPDQIKLLKALATRWRADVILIEDKSTGPSIAQALWRDPSCWQCEGRMPAQKGCAACGGSGTWARCLVQLEPVEGDKVVRMSAELPNLRDGQYGVPADCKAVPPTWQGVGYTPGINWVQELRDEMLHFPRGKYKDRCDQFSQYGRWRRLNPLPRTAGVGPVQGAMERPAYGEQSRTVSRAVEGKPFAAF